MECSFHNFLNYIGPLLFSCALIFGFDLFLLYINKRSVGRWYKLHAFANVIVCLSGFSDTVASFFNPIASNDSTNLLPSTIVLCLHLYHIVMFVNLAIIDWVHHIVMMSLLLITFACPDIATTNYILFMTSGFPGGLDYLLLIAVKEGYLSKTHEKELNAKINIWLRGPGIIIGAYIIFLKWRYHIINYSQNLVLLVVAGLIWNAQYFTKRVVYNWAEKNIDTI